MKKLLFLLLTLLMIGCSHKQFSQWDASDMWYQTDKPADDNLVDVFYITSTVTNKSVDANGNEVFRAQLTPDERKQFYKEMDYAKYMFGDSVNFFSPYYHQFTLSAINATVENRMDSLSAITQEVCDAFDYYMKHYNKGRRFIIAGFSQGAMHTLSLLKHISDKQYEHLVAAYMIGYRLTAEDLKNPHIKPAMSETGTGVTVSFNSVTSTDAIWHDITDGAAVCINPINWTTDATPAPLYYHGDTATVKVDTAMNVLIVEGLDISKYYTPGQEAFYPKGNLHHWDLLFYRESIKANAYKRAY